MSQQPFEGFSDMMVLGEFCEKDGPVVRELWGLDNEPLNINEIPGAHKALHTFMMRAMSGDHVYPEVPEPQLQCRSCDVLMDRVKWIDGSMLVAYICSVTLFDLHARGYARTACIAYLSHDDHKMFTISHWLSLECQAIARTMFDASLERHKREIVRAIDALERAKAVQDERSTGLGSLITDRHRSALASELDALKARVFRLPELAAALAQGPALISPLTTAGGAAKRKASKVTKLVETAMAATPSEESPVAATPDTLTNSMSFEMRLASSTSQSFAEGSYVYTPLTDEEILAILNALITKKGTGELRTLATLCGGEEFDRAIGQIRRTVWTFSQDTVWLMENVLQVMMPLGRVLERPLGELLTASWTWAAEASVASSPRGSDSGGELSTSDKKPQRAAAEGRPPVAPDCLFYFKIGDCLVVEPSLRLSPPFPPTNSLTSLTVLHEDSLFHSLKEHGVAPILAVMFNALRCVPIVVCGEDPEDVASAMRIAATFVPGLFQSNDGRFGTALCNFPMKHRVAPEHLLRFAVIGCPTEAILYESKPIYPSACVWHVQKVVRDRKGGLAKSRTACVHGAPYTLNPKGGDHRAAVPAAFVDPFGLDAVQVPVGVGLLLEIHDILSIRAASAAEDIALSNFLRLTLKRVFLEYGTMTALVMQSLLHDTVPRASMNSGNLVNTSFAGHTPRSPALRISFSSASMATVCGPEVQGPVLYSHRVPYVVTEADVRAYLEGQHGYTQVHSDDLAIVTGMLSRMMTLALENEKQ